MALFIITARPGIRHFNEDGTWTFEGVSGTDGGKPVSQMTFRKAVEIEHKQDAVRAFYDYAAEMNWLVTEGWGGMELTAELRKGDRAPKGFRQVVWDHYVPPRIERKYSDDELTQVVFTAIAEAAPERMKEAAEDLKDWGRSITAAPWSAIGLGGSAALVRLGRERVWDMMLSWIETHSSVDAIERDIRETIAAGEQSQSASWKTPFDKVVDHYQIVAWQEALDFIAYMRRGVETDRKNAA